MLALTRSNEKDKEKKTITIIKLRASMTMQTLLGPRTVQTVLKCYTNPEASRTMCILGVSKGNGLLVTPWHPVLVDSRITWKFLANLDIAQKIDSFKEPVYVVQL